MRWPFTN